MAGKTAVWRTMVLTTVALPLRGAGLVLTAPSRAVKAAEEAAGLAGEAVDLGKRVAATGSRAGLAAIGTTGRAVRDALTCSDRWWQGGRRIHLPLRLPPGSPARAKRLAGRAVTAVLEHPEVVSAYWDGGLARLVVRLAEGAVTERVAAEVAALAQRHGLSAAEPEPGAHPGDLGEVRTAALALAVSGAGLTTALTARALWQRRPPRTASAVLSVVREDPRLRSALRVRLGDRPAELVLAAAGAAMHGFGQAPVEALLETVVRTGQLFDAVARVSVFERAHDTLCVPGRAGVAGVAVARPPMPDPVTGYASTASTGGVVGAIATALFTRSLSEAGEAVLAGSPKPARFGWAAYAATLGQVLAREGVLVRAPDRLRALQTVDTLLVHAGALRLARRTVLEAVPHDPEWGDGRLWQAADEALAAEEPALRLRPAPGNEAGSTGLMVASDRDGDVGSVLVGYAPDPVAEALLDAAGQAGLRVVVLDDGAPGGCVAPADELVAADSSLTEVLERLRADGHGVLTVARLAPRADQDTAVLTGLLGSDLAVCLADGAGAVAWDADVLCVDGLRGAWRLVRAVPAARAAGKHAVAYAQAATALSSLLVITGRRRWRRLPTPLARISPVDLAAAAALLSGCTFAAGVALAPAPVPREQVPWHALAAEEVVRRVRAETRRHRRAALGLAAQGRRFVTHLGSVPGAGPARAPLRLANAVRAELRDPLTPVLGVGAGASAILGSTADALLVLGAMGVNAVVGGVQRLRAEHALSSLAASQKRLARVAGDGPRHRVVDADGLVPGDVVELRDGDVVPADARLLELEDLEVDESALTGESLPVTKQLTATPASAIGDRRCMVFEGTTVVAGRARAVVVGTGDDTETGRAVALASRTPPAAGVQARLRELTGKALPVTLAGGASVTGLSLLRGRPVRQAVAGGVAVAVAAVPEGLPLVATVAQMAAARRLSRHGILVRTARTLEALGRVDTVCFDKTGTLTENRLRVVDVATADGVVRPAGEPAAAEVLAVAARACPREPAGPGKQTHATDEAVLLAGPADDTWDQVAGLPFEASRGCAAAVGSTSDGVWLAVKGAPEVVLAGCAEAPDDAEEVAGNLAAQGLRVLAVARRRVSRDDTDEALDRPLSGLEFVGLLALADTSRPSAAPLVRGLREAGVRPVVLTGDHPQTARAIAVGLGWPEDTVVVTGDELAALDRDGRARLLAGAGVVARVAPEQKLQVVEALRAAGRVVAMVGDGANDAAAIRAADVGVGIAARGSAAARNAADLVLTGDDLAALVGAVDEGRALWRSVADAVSILIGGNAGEVGFTVLGTLLSGASPLSTRQLLLVNLLTDMFPAMAIAVTPPDSVVDDAGEPGAPVGAAVLGAPLSRQIRRRGVVTGIGAATGWLLGACTPGTARRTSTMALCGLVGSQLVQTLSGRGRSPLVLVTGVGSAAVLFAVVQTPGVSHFFGCTPLGPLAWTGVAAATGTAAAGPLFMPPLEAMATRIGHEIRRRSASRPRTTRSTGVTPVWPR
jgi:cation-transporting ATPase I